MAIMLRQFDEYGYKEGNHVVRLFKLGVMESDESVPDYMRSKLIDTGRFTYINENSLLFDKINELKAKGSTPEEIIGFLDKLEDNKDLMHKLCATKEVSKESKKSKE